MKKWILSLVLLAALFASLNAQAKTTAKLQVDVGGESELLASLPANLNCKQVTAVYGRFASDRIRTVPTVSMDSSQIVYVNKGRLDNEVVITLEIDGEQVTDLIFTIEDLKAIKTAKLNTIRGLYRESASYHDTWVDALTVVDCLSAQLFHSPDFRRR